MSSSGAQIPLYGGRSAARQTGTHFARCTSCDSPRIVPSGSHAGYAIARCNACDHRFVSQTVETEVLDEAYSAGYYGATAGDKPSAGYSDYLAKATQRMEAFRSRLRGITRYTGRPGSVLDFGCAVGLFVKVAKEEGWEAKGYERSVWAVEYARRVFGLDIELGSGEIDPFAPGSFDVVTLWDVVEHVESPREIMSLVRRWLRNGGIVALNTINASSLGARLAGPRWRHLAPPHHLQFFCRRSLKRLLDESGFRLLSVTTNGTCLDAAIGARPSTTALRLDGLLRHWRLRPVVSMLNILDEIEVIAVKK